MKRRKPWTRCLAVLLALSMFLTDQSFAAATETTPEEISTQEQSVSEEESSTQEQSVSEEESSSEEE